MQHLQGRLAVCRHLGALLLISCVWTRLPGADCNGNSIEDAQDIAAGTSRDCNRNGVMLEFLFSGSTLPGPSPCGVDVLPDDFPTCTTRC